MDVSLVYRKNERFVEKAIGEEKVLVPLTDNVADMNKVYNLNEVASFIYDAIDGVKSMADLKSVLLENYEVTEEVALNDIKYFITDMVDKGVLSIKS
ncbi:PqqD family protein [Saccharicrinis fermentans]|uniref:SynChlorMet cassette protein ScmD n=1 Tax=Saccharicrinis fermentans DSM 9555 = JCM 21142 TaxID=869213 RepID=W7YI37_9BACT|nr:PqqD family protein [Saccharicrinis fermentans]GAF04141.1 SynChlorMet cassette protein ScmD [Saccharicrinis fermentans DSM 9555 = JCM 21142]